MAYAVMLYHNGDSWCAEVPDFDYDGAFSPTRQEVLGMIRAHILSVRASYLQQDLEHRPAHQCVILTIDEQASYTPWEDENASGTS